MNAHDLLRVGRFEEAISAYRENLIAQPDDIPSMRGLSKAYLGERRYAEAIPLLWRVHEDEKSKFSIDSGRQMEVACACWCLEDSSQAGRL